MTQPARSSIAYICLALVSLAIIWQLGVWLGFFTSSPPNYTVTGTVTFKGTPVPAGFIVFSPDSAKSTAGSAASAEIKTGRFATPRGRGVLGGSYIATINAYDGKAIIDKNVVRPDSNAVVNPLGTPLASGIRRAVDLPKKDSQVDFDLD